MVSGAAWADEPPPLRGAGAVPPLSQRRMAVSCQLPEAQRHRLPRSHPARAPRRLLGRQQSWPLQSHPRGPTEALGSMSLEEERGPLLCKAYPSKRLGVWGEGGLPVHHVSLCSSVGCLAAGHCRGERLGKRLGWGGPKAGIQSWLCSQTWAL